MRRNWERGNIDPPSLLSVNSISKLIDARSASPALGALRRSIAAMRVTDSRTLIVRLEIMTDPLQLWAAHLVLDTRNVAPALRWPANEQDEQALYVTWSADLLWLCRRNPEHSAQFRSWQGLFKHAPGSAGWHATAHRNFMFVQPRYSIAHWCSKGLNLADADRELLMTMPTNAMCAARRGLESERFGELQRLLVESAMAKPDKAARHSPHQIAMRRAAMWRTFVLSCRRFTVATEQWRLITGEQITRQAFTKQIKATAEIVRCASLGTGR